MLDERVSKCLNTTMKTFSEFWSSLTAEQKHKLVADAETDYSYLSQVANGHRNAGSSLIERLIAADKRISFQMMRARPEEAA